MYGFTSRGVGRSTSTAPEYKESRLRTRSRTNTCSRGIAGVLPRDDKRDALCRYRLRLVKSRFRIYCGFLRNTFRWSSKKRIGCSGLRSPIPYPSATLTVPLTFGNSGLVAIAVMLRIRNRQLLSACVLSVRKANACVKCCVQRKDESQFNADDLKAVTNMSWLHFSLDLTLTCEGKKLDDNGNFSTPHCLHTVFTLILSAAFALQMVLLLYNIW